MSDKEINKQPPDNEGHIEVNNEGSLQENSAADNSSEAHAEVEKLKVELDEAKDKYVRKIAEFENFKRRNAKERIELMQTAGKEVITSMLDVLDDCDRAQKQIEASDDI